MSKEIELKLQLSPKSSRKLAAHPALAAVKPQKLRLLNTYYDTPELTLHQRRIALRFRQKGWQWLLTVKSAEPASGGLALRSEWETAATPGCFDFRHVDDAELRSFLENCSERLVPVFTTNFKRQIWHLPFGESLIELAIDRGHIESGGKRQSICEVELELLSGEVPDIFGLTRHLQDQIDLVPAIASKAERGYQLFSDTPLRPFRAKNPTLETTQTPVEAFRCIALNCLEHFQRNEPGLIDGTAPEFVHQARVALRRLRSAIKLFAPVLPAEFVAAYGKTWQTLAGALGEARNWDVFSGETLPPIQAAFPNDRSLHRLRSESRQRAKSARQAIVRLLAVREYPRLLVEFTAAVYALGDTLPIPIEDFAHKRIATYARRARKLAAAHATLNAAERHSMRISFKKLRYSLEFFATLLPKKRLATYLAALAQLQDQLGLINDQITAAELIREALGKRPPGPIHGWVAGRHELLLEELPATLSNWIIQSEININS